MAGGKDALLRSAEGAEDETDQALNLMRQHRVALR
jgi:N-acetylmuramic acid 6-phosphate (MurNAc-6-P) etherase